MTNFFFTSTGDKSTPKVTDNFHDSSLLHVNITNEQSTAVKIGINHYNSTWSSSAALDEITSNVAETVSATSSETSSLLSTHATPTNEWLLTITKSLEIESTVEEAKTENTSNFSDI